MNSDDNSRKEFLMKMYDQMFNDINRHILVNWQSTGVLIGAFAIFALTEKQIISLDIATTLILLISGWLLAHLYDASYWYNRNLVIIANIERQFLSSEDLKSIHYYFGKHRPKNRMIFHLKIQFAFGLGIAAIVLIFHFIKEIIPNFSFSITDFNLLAALPYITAISIAIYLFNVNKNRDESYQEFIDNSPGINIETTEIKYGTGHGFRKGEQ